MRNVTIHILAVIALFGGILTAQQSNAEQASPFPPGVDQAQDQTSVDVSAFGQALSSEKLGVQSGRQAVSIENLDAMLSSVTMNGSQQDNSISGNSFTGMNTVSGNAFSNMNGFATVIQNSGNQVLIQNDLIVNVNLH